MNESELARMESLLARHIIDIAMSDSYVENLLLSRLRSIAYEADADTKEAIQILIECFD